MALKKETKQDPPFKGPWRKELKTFLDEKAALYNRPEFIEGDPLSIPHSYDRKQDKEIAGFFAATFAWGKRQTVIKKCRTLLSLMDHAPYDFVLNHKPTDLKRFDHFRHRTFLPPDTQYFIRFFRYFYSRHASLEEAFIPKMINGSPAMEEALKGFHRQFCSLPGFPARTRKHIATPGLNSTCKRLNMFLRWMVRKDNSGVDLGLWSKIRPSQLLCPVDVHVGRVAGKLQLVTRKQTDWKTTLELSRNLRKLDPVDPVKYDLALFGLGIIENF